MNPFLDANAVTLIMLYVLLALTAVLLFLMAWMRHKYHQHVTHLSDWYNDQLKEQIRQSESRELVLATNQRNYYEMNEEMNKISLFLRQHYVAEIQLGRHANRPMSDIIIGYLQAERFTHQQEFNKTGKE